MAIKWICFLLMALSASATIIPADRVAGGPNAALPWQGIVGIPGGITNRSVIFANVKNPPYNAKGDGVTDDSAAIQSALNACPSEQVVYIPTGTYHITTVLQLKASYTVRGDGPGLTIIDWHGGNGEVIGFGGIGSQFVWYRYGPIATANITGGTSLGSTQITIDNASGFSAGNMLNIDVLNDTNGVIGVSPIGNNGFQNVGARDPNATRSLGQVVVITNISGTTINFDPPLCWYFTNVPQATTYQRFNSWSGVENLTVNNNNTGCDTEFSMYSVSHCWLKNVETEWADGDHIIIDGSARCEVRDSYIHDGYTHGPGSHDCTLRLDSHSSGLLIENNIFRRQHIAVMPNGGGGNGSVIAYNFMTNQFDSSSPFPATLNNVQLDIEYHGAHVLMTLFEGNVLNGFSQDGVWGTSSHGTLLRNYITAQNWIDGPYTNRGPEDGNYIKQYGSARAIALAGVGNSKYFNVVGNVLGTAQMGNYPTYSPVYMFNWPSSPRQFDHYGIIYTMGYSYGSDDGTQGGSGFPWNQDNTDPITTLINHGNWDAVSGTQTFSNNISDHVIPQSYYLSGKPAFFGNMTWPPIDPTVPPSRSILIPAQCRYYGGTCSSITLNDVPLTNTMVSLLTPTVSHIHNQGNYAGFAIRLSSNLGNDGGLYVYKQQGRQIQLINFTPGLYTNIGLGNDIALFGSTCVLAGGSPIGLPGMVYEFTLGNQQPLPTSLSLVTNFNVGDSTAQKVAVVKHSGGGVAVFFGSNSNALWTCYRFPNGTWTNYGSVALPGLGNAASFLTAAEQLSDHSIWVWFNNDATGKISTSQFVTNSVGLRTNQVFQYVDNSFTGGVHTWGAQAPYGEIVQPMESISDTFSNRILLAYNTDLWFESDGDYNTRVTPAVLAGFNANTNHYVYTVSSNNMIRLGGLLGVTQVGSSTYLTVQADTTNSETTVSSPTNSFPVYFQQVTDNAQFAPIFGWNNYTYNSYFSYRNDAMEFVGRYQDLSWHLLSFNLPPINPIVQNVSAQYIGKSFSTGLQFQQ